MGWGEWMRRSEPPPRRIVAPGVRGGAGGHPVAVSLQMGRRKRNGLLTPSGAAQAHPRASPGLRGAGGCLVRLAAARHVGDFIAMGR